MAPRLIGTALSRYMNENFTPEQWRSMLVGNQPNPASGTHSQWNELNGRLIGDTYLPPDVSTVDVGNGWYEVHHGGGRVGTLRPGGDNGRFINDTSWRMPQPGLVAGPTQPAIATPQSQLPASSGPYGNQAAQMAGLLAQQQPQQQPMMGLLGGGPKGFRLGGK